MKMYLNSYKKSLSPLATQNIAVSTPQFSVAMAGPSGANPSTLSRNTTHGTSAFVPELFPQSRPMNAGNFDGFSFPGNFSTPATMTVPYPGLDGHTRRITPIPISFVQDQPSTPAIQKSPEQIQRDNSDLIQRLQKEKAE